MTRGIGLHHVSIIGSNKDDILYLVDDAKCIYLILSTMPNNTSSVESGKSLVISILEVIPYIPSLVYLALPIIAIYYVALISRKFCERSNLFM